MPIDAVLVHARPPVERYVRCSVHRAEMHSDWVVEPGIEWREGDDFEGVAKQLRGIAWRISALGHLDPIAAAKEGEAMIADRWPDRAFFIEVHDPAHAVWSQTYQPYGMPRFR